jgi:hypothetical protein
MSRWDARLLWRVYAMKRGEDLAVSRSGEFAMELRRR